MELWKEVRHRVLTKKLSQRAACKEYGLGWHTLRNLNSSPSSSAAMGPRILDGDAANFQQPEKIVGVGESCRCSQGLPSINRMQTCRRKTSLVSYGLPPGEFELEPPEPLTA